MDSGYAQGPTICQLEWVSRNLQKWRQPGLARARKCSSRMFEGVVRHCIRPGSWCRHGLEAGCTHTCTPVEVLEGLTERLG